jgi:hypothetical protein
MLYLTKQAPCLLPQEFVQHNCNYTLLYSNTEMLVENKIDS